MNKHIQKISIALILLIAICNASPARLDKLRASRSKFLARQEVADDIPAQTPYPPAGNKPEVAFDLPTDAKLEAPDNTYLPPVVNPAETYGPPEVSGKEDVEELTNDETVQEQPDELQAENDQPEKIESPDDTDDTDNEEQQVADEDESEQNEAEIKQDNIVQLPERLVLAKSNGRKSAKLQAAAPLRGQSFVPQPIFVVGNNGQLYRLLY